MYVPLQCWLSVVQGNLVCTLSEAIRVSTCVGGVHVGTVY